MTVLMAKMVVALFNDKTHTVSHCNPIHCNPIHCNPIHCNPISNETCMCYERFEPATSQLQAINLTTELSRGDHV